MLRPLFALPLLLIFMGAQNAAPPAPPIPGDTAATPNPVHPTPEMLARAKMLYGIDCAMCHGEHGDGKGDLVSDMKLSMHDWTATPSPLDGMKDGEILEIIKNGKDKMPPEAGRAKDEELSAMVIYLRSLAKKQ